MKVYTKVGDEGKTAFFGCGMIQKDDPRIEAVGALDEVNSVIGVTLCFIENEELRRVLQKVQNDLFQVGADLAGSALEADALPRIRESHVIELEKAIDNIHEKVGGQQAFILPGGTSASSFLHLCRCITRRAERSLIVASKVISLNPEMLRYVNRLSDYLFMLAREANNEVDVKEQQPIYKYFDVDKSKDHSTTKHIN